MASRKISVEIVGDASSLTKAFNKASTSSSSFGSSLGKLAKYSALAVGAAGVGGLAIVLKQGIAEFSEAAKVAAQTNAVLKSTGGIANVTAKQVDALASSLMKKSGVDDEAIASGENLLLTFTNIRNEAGKGNDIFDQATKATLNLSVAMGKDMSSSAILVGKALNDPIKGMTALSRAGVQLSADQVKLIKGFVATGDVMSAQKVLLGELTTQFGGSAEAIGQTLPGKLSILKESFNNLAGEVVGGAVPAFTKLVDGLTVAAEGVGKFVDKFQKAKGLEAKVKVVLESGREVFDKAVVIGRGLAKQIGDELAKVDFNAAGIKMAAGIGEALRKGLPVAGALAATLSVAFVTAVNEVDWVKVGQAIASGIKKGAVDGITNFAKDPVKLAKVYSTVLLGVGVTKALGALAYAGGQEPGAKLGEGFGTGIDKSAPAVKTKSGRLAVDAAQAALANAYGSGLQVGADFGRGVGAGIASQLGYAAAQAEALVLKAHTAARAAAQAKSPSKLMAVLGHDFVEGFILGITDKTPEVKGKITEAVINALEAARSKVEGFQTRFGDAFGKLADFARRAFDAKTGSLLANIDKKFQAKIATWSKLGDALTPAEKALADMDRAEAKRSRDLALASATESGDPEAIRAAQLAITRAGLEDQAAIERKALDERVAANIAKLDELKAKEAQNLEERRSQLGTKLDEQLVTLQEKLAKHPEQYKTINKQILAVLAKFGVPMKESGALLGSAFADGIRSAKKDVVDAATDLAKAVQQILRLKSPAEKGPLSTLDKWWKPMGPMLASQLTTGAVTAGASRLAGAAVTTPTAAAGFGGAGAMVASGNVTIPVSIGTEVIATIVWDQIRQKAAVFEQRNQRPAF